MSGEPPSTQEEPEEVVIIEKFKIKELIPRLTVLRGKGTQSMLSLALPHEKDIDKYKKMITQEYGFAATNIKSRVNRFSALSAIYSTQQRLKLYNRTPPNGIVIYCGAVVDGQGNEKNVSFVIEPCKPINATFYMCDHKFHTQCLQELVYRCR